MGSIPSRICCDSQAWLSTPFRNYGDVWVARIPLLAEEGWRDSLIEAGAPGAKREPVRAKPQLVVSSAKMFCRSDHPVYAFASLSASTPPLRGGEYSSPRSIHQQIQAKCRCTFDPSTEFGIIDWRHFFAAE